MRLMALLESTVLRYASQLRLTFVPPPRFQIFYHCVVLDLHAFSALMLLVGRQEGHPACKQLSGGVLAWLSVWSKVQTCIQPS